MEHSFQSGPCGTVTCNATDYWFRLLIFFVGWLVGCFWYPIFTFELSFFFLSFFCLPNCWCPELASELQLQCKRLFILSSVCNQQAAVPTCVDINDKLPTEKRNNRMWQAHGVCTWCNVQFCWCCYCADKVLWAMHCDFCDLFIIFFTTLLTHWDCSHGEFWLLCLGKASCDNHSSQPTMHTCGSFSVSIIHWQGMMDYRIFNMGMWSSFACVYTRGDLGWWLYPKDILLGLECAQNFDSRESGPISAHKA